jgi:hypothetical protein
MGYVGYETPIAQSDYLSAGLISAVLGFFLDGLLLHVHLWFIQLSNRIQKK